MLIELPLQALLGTRSAVDFGQRHAKFPAACSADRHDGRYPNPLGDAKIAFIRHLDRKCQFRFRSKPRQLPHAACPDALPLSIAPSFREAEDMRVLRHVEGLQVVLVEELFATTNTFQKVHAWFAGAGRGAYVIVPR